MRRLTTYLLSIICISFSSSFLTVSASVSQPPIPKVSDRRCKCLCQPDLELDIPQKIYINSNKSEVPTAKECACYSTVVPTVRKEYPNKVKNVSDFESEYCKLCGCEFETRNIGVINFSMRVYFFGMIVLLGYF